jgi:hypothetical protein
MLPATGPLGAWTATAAAQPEPAPAAMGSGPVPGRAVRPALRTGAQGSPPPRRGHGHGDGRLGEVNLRRWAARGRQRPQTIGAAAPGQRPHAGEPEARTVAGPAGAAPPRRRCLPSPAAAPCSGRAPACRRRARAARPAAARYGFLRQSARAAYDVLAAAAGGGGWLEGTVQACCCAAVKFQGKNPAACTGGLPPASAQAVK